MKHCELCKAAARIYCESDQASLCWTCDAKVHSANFLVARHSRAILCNSCHSPTPWSSSGSDLVVAVAVCESCFAGDNDRSDDLDLSRESSNIDEIDDDDDEEVENDDGENQVVPWSSAATPPPPASPSSSEDIDDDDSSSSYGGGEASASSSSSSLKKRSREDLVPVSSLKRRYLIGSGTRTTRSSSAESSEFRKTRTIQVSQVKPNQPVQCLSHRNLGGGGFRAVDPNSSESPRRTI